MRKAVKAEHGAYREALSAFRSTHPKSSVELIPYGNGCFGVLLDLESHFTVLLGNDSANFTELSISLSRPRAVRKLVANAPSEASARNYFASMPHTHSAALPPFQGSPLSLAAEKYVEWVECQVERYGEEPLQASLTASTFRDLLHLLTTAEQNAFTDRILHELHLETK